MINHATKRATKKRRYVIAMLLTLLSLLLSLSFAQDDRSAAEYIRDGQDNFERGDCAFAQYLFQEALKLEAGNIEGMLGKGRSLVCQGALALGIEEFQKARDVDPNNIDVHVQLARAYKEQYDADRDAYASRLTDALGVLQTAERLAPDNAEVLNMKGVVLFSQGDLDTARTSLERAVSLAAAPESGLNDLDVSVMNANLGRVYRDQGDLELALQAFRRAVSLNPKSAVAHNYVGNAYYMLGRCDDAVYELNQATSLQPSYLEAKANLAIALFECGDVAGSVSHFESALELPGSLNLPPLYTYVSRAYVSLGRFDDAVKRAQQGALLPPVTAEAFYYLGQAYEGRNGAGDIERAKEAYESALELNPNDQLSQDALGRLP